MHFSWKTTFFRKSSDRLWIALLVIVFIQARFVHQTSLTGTITAEEKTDAALKDDHTSLFPSSTSNTLVKPRILIGIFSDLSIERRRTTNRAFRQRHRDIFRIWNDNRVCAYNDYKEAPSEFSNCIVLYTFVLAAHNKTAMDMPTILLEDTLTLPLELNRTFPDNDNTGDLMQSNDYTILNIRENMNQGKSPTFFVWAKRAADALGISYVGKCDSDAMLRLGFLLKFLYEDIAWTPRTTSTVLGSMRHKAFWNHSKDFNLPSEDNSETFWESHYHNGMHLYLGGEFYLISTDLVDGMASEAIKLDQPYFEGHEDHDVLSMIQVSNENKLIRWISMPHNYRFWEHPVKGDFWWGRILKRTMKKALDDRLLSNTTYEIPRPLPISTSSILVVVGATSPQTREIYRKQLHDQTDKRICSFADYKAFISPPCGMFYLFVIGGNPNAETEKLDNIEDLVLSNRKKGESDLIVLNIRDNIDKGVGQTILYYLDSHFNGTLKNRFDMVLFCQSSYIPSFSKWKGLQESQSVFPRNLLVGDLRDKDETPREFVRRSYEPVVSHDIHLYLGSDTCFALSANLVSGIVDEAYKSSKNITIEAKRGGKKYYIQDYLENNLGHDITTFAHFIPNTALHWIPVTKNFKLWTRIDS